MTSVWVDANVLLRLLTDEPPWMAEKAVALARRAERKEIELRVSVLVVAEVVWVLTSYYKRSRAEIAHALVPLLLADGVWAEDRELVIGALGVMSMANVDFVDAYLAELARENGQAVCSFDKDFLKLNVELVTPG